jgi:hypothetical protein
MGGFWVDPDNTKNYIWHHPFPHHICQELQTFDNPDGTITNSDLELAALVVGSDTIAATHTNPPYQHICIASDNTPTVAWLTKGSTTSNGPPAYLLRLLTQSRRNRRYQVSSFFLPGSTNTIADCCSRLFSLPDGDFVDYMNKYHPVQPSWTLVQPSNATLLATNSALCRRLLPLESPPVDIIPAAPLGIYGSNSAHPYTMTPTCNTSQTPYPSYKSSLIDTPPASWLPVAVQSALAQWRVPFEPWGRRWPHWAAPIQDCNRLAN